MDKAVQRWPELKLGREDYETAKIVAAGLAVEVGLVTVYDESRGRYRVFGEDGRPQNVATLSEMLALIFCAVDNEHEGYRHVG